MEYIELGSVPGDEDCAQINSENYEKDCKEECKRYITLLTKKFPEFASKRVEFRRRSFSHDFGVYYEVVVSFDENDEDAAEFAYFVENNLPATWND